MHRCKWDDMWRLYRLKQSDYQDLAHKQEGRCAVCNEPFNDDDNIDHCHKSGKVRGLLCSHCNKGLGFFKDSTLKLLKAIIYLTTRGK